MVMTVEPGIYISTKANVPEKYKGIGVRIEDNIVITAKGNEVLTRNTPKTVEDIEAFMAKR
jgi:Xaa-Pro aminopeptidase